VDQEIRSLNVFLPSESLTPISAECNIARSLLFNPNPVVTYFHENHERNRLPTR
jgi:hypothetical protein